METEINSRYYWVEIHQLLCFWLEISTKHNRGIMITMGLKPRTLWFLNEKASFWLLGPVWAKCQSPKSRLLSRNQGILCSCLIVATGKTSTVKDLKQPKNDKYFWSRWWVKQTRDWYQSPNKGMFSFVWYIVLPWGMYKCFKRLGPQRE